MVETAKLALPAYDLALPGRVVFGWGRRRELPALARCVGRRALLISGSRTLRHAGVIEELTTGLTQGGLAVETVGGLAREPLVADVDDLVTALRQCGAGAGDFLFAIGGGSALDVAKAAGGVLTNGGSVRDYLEGVGAGRQIEQPPLPLLAMPTTGGTGTEATRNAVISSVEPPFKKSIRSPLLMPKAVLIDPELAVSLPPAVTAATGMDAITQLIESFITRKSNPFCQALALEALPRALAALPAAYVDPSCRWAREALAHAAFVSGVALANSGLGLAHGIAAALGIHAHVPHGLACAALLPAALEVNRIVAGHALTRLAQAVTGDNDATAHALEEKVRKVGDAVGIPLQLRQLGVERAQLPAIAHGSRGNSMSGNPCELTDAELLALLERLW